MNLMSIITVLGLSHVAVAMAPTRSLLAGPETKHMFSVNITTTPAYLLGQTPLGQRVFEQLGGNFSGSLSGTKSVPRTYFHVRASADKSEPGSSCTTLLTKISL